MERAEELMPAALWLALSTLGVLLILLLLWRYRITVERARRRRGRRLFTYLARD